MELGLEFGAELAPALVLLPRAGADTGADTGAATGAGADAGAEGTGVKTARTRESLLGAKSPKALGSWDLLFLGLPVRALGALRALGELGALATTFFASTRKVSLKWS